MLRAQRIEQDEAARQLELEVQHTTAKREAKMRVELQKLQDEPSYDAETLPQDERVELFTFDFHNKGEGVSLHAVNIFRPQRSTSLNYARCRILT